MKTLASNHFCPGLVGTYSGNLPINETLQRILDEPKYSIWIFAYGSLCWNPGFEVRDRVYGHINGYSRKFWQGDSTYRGTSEQFGRTATLIKEVQILKKWSALDFWKIEVEKSSWSNLNFAGYTGSKNQVQTRKKSSSSNYIF